MFTGNAMRCSYATCEHLPEATGSQRQEAISVTEHDSGPADGAADGA